MFKIAEKFRPYYEQKAKEQQGKRTDLFQKPEKSEETTFVPNDINVEEEKSDTIQKLADIAGVGRNTMNKVIQIQKHAPEPIKDAVESNVISINKGYELTKRVKDVPEEQKETEAERMIREGFKEIETNIAIQKNVHNAIYKILCVGFTDEELDIWYDGLDKCDLEILDDDLDRAIEKYKYIKEFIKQKRTIRRIK